MRLFPYFYFVWTSAGYKQTLTYQKLATQFFKEPKQTTDNFSMYFSKVQLPQKADILAHLAWIKPPYVHSGTSRSIVNHFHVNISTIERKRNNTSQSPWLLLSLQESQRTRDWLLKREPLWSAYVSPTIIIFEKLLLTAIAGPVCRTIHVTVTCTEATKVRRRGR